ncbi:hypothetical protein M8J76_014689 [Diaphorina citri]|nr:hypothetical protein M8J76_014689 [Diaphorina citri]
MAQAKTKSTKLAGIARYLAEHLSDSESTGSDPDNVGSDPESAGSDHDESSDLGSSIAKITFEIIENMRLKSDSQSEKSKGTGSESETSKGTDIQSEKGVGAGSQPETSKGAGSKSEKTSGAGSESGKVPGYEDDYEDSDLVTSSPTPDWTTVKSKPHHRPIPRSSNNHRTNDHSVKDKDRTGTTSTDKLEDDRNLYVYNVDPSVTEKSLRAHFAGFGTIQSAMVHHYRGQRLKTPSPAHPTGTPAQPAGTPRPGYGFVNFTTPHAAQKALTALDGSELGNRTLGVKYALVNKYRRGDTVPPVKSGSSPSITLTPGTSSNSSSQTNTKSTSADSGNTRSAPNTHDKDDKDKRSATKTKPVGKRVTFEGDHFEEGNMENEDKEDCEEEYDEEENEEGYDNDEEAFYSCEEQDFENRDHKTTEKDDGKSRPKSASNQPTTVNKPSTANNQSSKQSKNETNRTKNQINKQKSSNTNNKSTNAKNEPDNDNNKPSSANDEFSEHINNRVPKQTNSSANNANNHKNNTNNQTSNAKNTNNQTSNVKNETTNTNNKPTSANNQTTRSRDETNPQNPPRPGSIEAHIENILTQVEKEFKAVFDKDKRELVQMLKREMEEELEIKFGTAGVNQTTDWYAMLKHQMVEVESTLHHLDKEDIGAQIRSQCFSLQGSIDAYFRRNDGADKRSACAKIMTDIGAIEENLKRYDDEDDMKARLVTQLILMEDTLGKFLRPDRTGDEARPDNGGGPEARKSDDSLSSASIQARIKSIDESKTLFLTNEIKEERDTRLARVRQRLKHVLHEQDARQLLRSVYIELKDSIKEAYLQEPMHPELEDRIEIQLNKMKTEVRDYQRDRTMRAEIIEELAAIQADIKQANVEGIRRFIQEQRDALSTRLARESNAIRRDNLKSDFSSSFWSHIETFLVAAFNDPATVSNVRDESINLYVRLRREFRQFGDIISARVFTEHDAWRRRWANATDKKTYGFVRFARAADAVSAMEKMNGVRLMGRVIEVSVATNEENTKTYWRYLLGKTLQLERFHQ